MSEIVDVEKGAMEEGREGVEKVGEKRGIGESFGGENDNGGCLAENLEWRSKLDRVNVFGGQWRGNGFDVATLLRKPVVLYRCIAIRGRAEYFGCVQ